jgi:hypothetical protein
MTDPQSRRRLPAPLARYADQIRAHAEELERQGHHEARPPGRRRRRILSVALGGGAAISAAVIVLLDIGRPAHAQSIVNRAPAAAAASESVRFSSQIGITLDSRHLEEYREHGAIDFAHRDFGTVLSLGREGGAIAQRRVGTHLYVSQIRHGHSQPTRWRSIRLAHEPIGRFASSPESEQFTSPPALLDGLASTRSPVTADGHEAVDGVPTDVYELHTNLAAFLRAASGGRTQPAAYQRVSATIAVALDEHGRPRRVKETFTGASARIRTIVTFTNYGAPVHIVAPPGSAVVAHAPTAAPEPIPVSPSRVFERLLFVSSTPDQPRG